MASADKSSPEYIAARKAFVESAAEEALLQVQESYQRGVVEEGAVFQELADSRLEKAYS